MPNDSPDLAQDRLLTVEDVAAYLGVPMATLYGWRYKQVGPPGIRVGRYVRYRRRDVEKWLDSRSEARTS